MEDDIKIIHFTGWHGADENSLEGIQENNFRESQGDEHWLGEGVYFFTNGIGNPQKHARNWAKIEAYKRKNTRYSVLESHISVNEEVILDLREIAGLELFNNHRSYVLNRLIRGKNKRFRNTNDDYSDGKVIEHLKQVAGIEVVVSNMYVQFGQDRIDKIYSRIPNCTFLCVSNPDENIDPASIKIVERGNI